MDKERIAELTDYQSEAGVISTIVYHPEFILHAPFLKAKHFYKTDNGCIFWAIQELYNNKITNIDAFNIQTMLKSNKKVAKTIEEFNLPEIQEYIDLCVETKRDTLEEFLLLAKKVTELAFKREFFKQTFDWQKVCFNSDINLSTLSNDVYKQFNKLTTEFITSGDIKTFGSKVSSIYDKIKEKKSRGMTYGLPSFFSILNKYVTYEETELIVIAARMKKGKSWLSLIEGLHKAMNGVPTMIYDSEMNDENFYIRVISYLSGIAVDRIKNAELTEEEENEVEKQNQYIETLPLYHLYSPNITKEEFYSICAKKKIEVGLKFVIWDYIKCDDSIISSSERSAYMGGVTNWLKNTIAGDLKMSVLAFCQLSRTNEIADSDGIERYCSASIRWEEKNNDDMLRDGVRCGTHKLKVKLNRLGLQHDRDEEYIDMMFTKEKVGIIECPQQHEVQNPFKN